MKVLVTGATSLLALRTAEALLARGDEVVCLQRHRAEIDAEQVLADVRDAARVRSAAAGCDAVVHAAAKVGVVGTWEDYRSINVDGTDAVLDAARSNGIGRLVHVSTPSVAHVGHSIVGGLAEPAATGHRRAWYPESKAVAEQHALAAASPSLAVVAVRPHLVWGPGDTQLVGRIVERARAGRLALVGGGTALIDTTYIDGAAGALVAALDAVGPDAACNGRAYVVANGEPRPIRELVLGICAAAGVEIEPRDVPRGVATTVGSIVETAWRWSRRREEPPLTRFLAEQLGTAHWFDPRPARDDLAWSPTVSIDEGLRRLAMWFASDAGRLAS
ncbi:MAG: putative steroid dehydrogenase [Ilumatobacteraceae bacterium]|nr:putative steroid dehydrogenase [Ilumatobacteraceae bacterium]